MRFPLAASVAVLALTAPLAILAAPALAQDHAMHAAPAAAAAGPVSTEIKDAAGKSIGTATLSDGPHGVLLRLQVKGLTPGWHGLHFHEKGDCGTPDFKSAGAHVHNAGEVVHGLLNPKGNDLGDLTNLYVAADGTANAEVFSSFVSLKGDGGRSALQDADGSSIVIHASPDDYQSQPIGGAGARVACAVIK